MGATPQIITWILQLYFTGESFRNVQKFLKLQDINVSHMGAYNWISKYVQLMEKYLERIKPNVGNAWRTDELFVKIKGDMKYLYALMDDETGFWIAQQVADTKYTANINPLFHKGKQVTGKRPNILISDGAPNSNDSFNKEFTQTRHQEVAYILCVHVSIMAMPKGWKPTPPRRGIHLKPGASKWKVVGLILMSIMFITLAAVSIWNLWLDFGPHQSEHIDPNTVRQLLGGR
jgi:transposase-like protein